MLNHNLIAIAADAVLIALVLHGLIKFAATVGSKEQVQFNALFVKLRVITVMVILYVSIYLTVYKGFTLVQLLRGVLSDLSLTSLLVFAWWLWGSIFKPVGCCGINRNFALVVSLLGLFLYLSTFGIISLDIYDSGYFPTLKFMLLFFVVEIYLWRHARSYAWLWLLALIGFYFKFESSHNLWDYLFDPVLWIICVFSLFHRR